MTSDKGQVTRQRDNTIYPKLSFLSARNRPIFYANFVSTLDGKVAVRGTQGYWPIGSEKDYQVLQELRAHSDVLIHGKTTALASHRTRSSLVSKEFAKLRKTVGKERPLIYFVLTNPPTPDILRLASQSPSGLELIVITHHSARIPTKVLEKINIVRIGKQKIDLNEFSNFLFARGIKNALVEGGPTLFGSFLAENLIDEIFLTIAPKIFGTKKDTTLSLVENQMFKPSQIKRFMHISVKPVEDEVFLRYRRVK